MPNRWAMPRGDRAVWATKRDGLARLRPESLDDEQLRRRMELRQDGRFCVCYAPLDYLRRGAHVAVVGLTPGRHTFRASVTAASEQLRDGASDAVALRRAKET